MSKETSRATRQFLTEFVNVLTKDQDAQLGYAMDSHYYGIPTFTDYVLNRLAKLTLEDVNRAIKTYLQARDVQIVVVTKGAEAFKKAALSGEPSPISYTSPPPAAILEEDKVIERFKLNFNPKQVRVVPVESVFQS